MKRGITLICLQVSIVEEPSSEPRETKPANLVALKTSASSLRDTIMQAEREAVWSGKGKAVKNLDKQRKNLEQLEERMVLALPHLLLQVKHDSYKQIFEETKDNQVLFPIFCF